MLGGAGPGTEIANEPFEALPEPDTRLPDKPLSRPRRGDAK